MLFPRQRGKWSPIGRAVSFGAGFRPINRCSDLREKNHLGRGCRSHRPGSLVRNRLRQSCRTCRFDVRPVQAGFFPHFPQPERSSAPWSGDMAFTRLDRYRNGKRRTSADAELETNVGFRHQGISHGVVSQLEARPELDMVHRPCVRLRASPDSRHGFAAARSDGRGRQAGGFRVLDRRDPEGRGMRV